MWVKVTDVTGDVEYRRAEEVSLVYQRNDHEVTVLFNGNSPGKLVGTISCIEDVIRDALKIVEGENRD